MSASPLGLLKTRRLWPLALTQSCGALNDNLVKNAMVVLALFQLGICLLYTSPSPRDS